MSNAAARASLRRQAAAASASASAAPMPSSSSRGREGRSRDLDGSARSRDSAYRARSRSRERYHEMEEELDDVAHGSGTGSGGDDERLAAIRGMASRARARSRSRERSAAMASRLDEQMGQVGGGSTRGDNTRASEEWDRFDANAELPKRAQPVTLDPSTSSSGTTSKPASAINIYDSMGAVSAISDVSGGTDQSSSDHGGGSRSRRQGGANTDSASAGAAERQQQQQHQQQQQRFSPNLPPNLHTSLAQSDWKSFHRALQHLAQQPSLIIPSASMTDPSNPNDSTTPLHTACWKAPPTLALKLISLLPSSRELSGIFTARDGDDNTALHLCAANLERFPDGESGGSGGSGGGSALNTSVVEALLRAAPRALKMQNAEGDTPLSMLVSSAACLPKSWNIPPGSREYDSAGIAAERALNLMLNASGGEEAALMRDMTGATPLHVAIASGAHGLVIDRLVEVAPQALKMPDNRGMIPLHYVGAFCHTPMSSVKRMFSKFPDSMFAITTNGDTPLHLLVSNSSNSITKNAGEDAKSEDGPKLDKNTIRVVEALMGPTEGSKSPLIMTNREKLTPLHCCALFDAPPNLSKLLMTHPAAKQQASAMTNSFGATPLHLACAQPSVAQSIATVLAVGTPEAAAVKDRLKRTPLHVASQNVHATANLIEALAQLYPQATAEKTQRGHLPLHLSSQSQAKEPVVKALIKAYPKAAQAKNKSSNTPLHDACKYRASAGVVSLLIETYPDAVYIQNQYGNLPLHCATAYQANSQVVGLLLNAYPKGAATQNRNRDAPLHYAAAYATDPKSVQPLIDAAPGALLMVNIEGKTPVDRAKANNSPDEIIRLLEEEASGVVPENDALETSWVESGRNDKNPFK